MPSIGDESVGRHWPAHGWLGIALVLTFWLANWLLPGLRTQWAFFPLWLGYCLTADALVVFRKGSSLLTDNPRAYVSLFFLSAPVWWIFELLNLFAQNWVYDGRQYFSNLEYVALASLSFSTVMPAVFSTTELFNTAGWIRRMGKGPQVTPSGRSLLFLFAMGWVMVLLLILRPEYFFPFLWLAVFFIIEPINAWRKHQSLSAWLANGDWRPVVALWCGCLVCAFFWEMWNFYSYPKWIYFIPYVDFLHIFEMPLLGYGGYLPFSLELFALYQLTTSVLKVSNRVQLFSFPRLS